MQALDIYYIVAVWFLFVLIFDKQTRLSATILFLCLFINIIMIDVFDLFGPLSFEESQVEFIKYKGVFALLMTMAMKIDKTAKVQAKIVCLTIACHSMISLYLATNNPALELLSFLFYEHYNELLILTALMHMVVSKDGMVRSLCGASETLRYIQGFLFRLDFYSGHNFKHLLTRKERES